MPICDQVVLYGSVWYVAKTKSTEIQCFNVFFVCKIVDPAGKMSNFLVEDYEAVMKFMKSEKHKKKILKR